MIDALIFIVSALAAAFSITKIWDAQHVSKPLWLLFYGGCTGLTYCALGDHLERLNMQALLRPHPDSIDVSNTLFFCLGVFSFVTSLVCITALVTQAKNVRHFTAFGHSIMALLCISLVTFCTMNILENPATARARSHWNSQMQTERAADQNTASKTKELPRESGAIITNGCVPAADIDIARHYVNGKMIIDPAYSSAENEELLEEM